MINIGTGVMVSINEVAGMIAKALDSNNPAVKCTYIDYNDERPRAIEVFTRCAEITVAIDCLQYKPETTLESGIKKYIEWYLKKQAEREPS